MHMSLSVQHPGTQMQEEGGGGEGGEKIISNLSAIHATSGRATLTPPEGEIRQTSLLRERYFWGGDHCQRPVHYRERERDFTLYS